MTKLRLSPDLTIPLEAITETIAILGIRGSGKTNTAAAYAEELLAAGQQVVILDPTDSWWGLKSSADGLKPGYPIVVLGGKHQDLPLASGDGKLVADFVVEQGISVICSLRSFESKGQELAFATAFLRRLYYLKGQQDSPTPLALIIDEASRLVPQRVMGEEAQCVGAVQQIVRQGRSSGFGVVLIDQRAATVNKDVLAMLEMLVIHRTTGPQDRKALREWVQQHDTGNREGTFLDSLASLAQGEAWFWSPGWLDLFRKVKVRARRTFDSSRTPKAGEVVITPKKLADVDLDALRTKLAATVEKAKADDPKELRREIAHLRKELAAKPWKATAAPVVDQRAIERAVKDATRGQEARYAKIKQAFDGLVRSIGVSMKVLDSVPANLRDAVTQWSARAETSEAEAKETADRPGRTVGERDAAAGVVAPVVRRPVAPPAPREAVGDGSLSNVQRKILDGLAFFSHLGMVPTRVQLAMHAGYTNPKSPGFTNPLGALRSAGYLDYGNGTVEATESGAQAGTATNTPETLDELHSVWLSRLPNVHQKILEQLIPTHGTAGLPRAELAAACGYTNPKSPGFTNSLGRLRTLGLIDYGQGTVFTTDALFPAGLR